MNAPAAAVLGSFLGLVGGVGAVCSTEPDFRFDNGRSALCIPFEAANRQVSLKARVNSRDSVWLVLDSGSSGSVLDGQLAEGFGLETFGSQLSLGAGGEQEGSTVSGVNVELPGFHLLGLTMDTLPLGGLSAMSGQPFDGILGHEIFARCVVEIDYAKRCLSLYVPASYDYSGRGAIVPIELIENHPYVTASVTLPGGKSVTGRFVIDTGSSGSLILAPDLVERENVLASIGSTLSTRAHGVGGPAPVRLGRIEGLELGGHSLARPIVLLQPAGFGRVSAPGTLGNIGGGILGRFKVIFDYPRRRLILEPGPGFSEPFEGDMSGLVLIAPPPEYNRIRVGQVLDGSPAAEAGIRPGDEVVSVDGTPAADAGVIALRERLRHEGEDVRLVLLRGEDRITVAFRTRRLI